MATTTTFNGAVSAALTSADTADNAVYSSDRANVHAGIAQAQALTALAFAVQGAGKAVGDGLVAIARALERR